MILGRTIIKYINKNKMKNGPRFLEILKVFAYHLENVKANNNIGMKGWVDLDIVLFYCIKMLYQTPSTPQMFSLFN